MLLKKTVAAAIFGALILNPAASVPIGISTVAFAAEQLTADEWYDKGWKRYYEDDYQGAIECYLKALEIDPNHEESLHDLAWAYSQLGWNYYQDNRYSEMVEVYTKLVELEPDDENYWDYLGDAYSGTGNYAKAVESYRRSLELSYTLHRNLGFIFYESYSGHAGITLQALGMAYMNLGNYDDAIVCFKESLAIYKIAIMHYDSRDAESWDALGCIYELQGRDAEAEDAFRNAVELCPSDENYKARLESILTKRAAE